MNTDEILNYYDSYYIKNNPYSKDTLFLYDIKKILKADNDTNKKFKDEIYGYKLYELDPNFGAKYSSLKSSFMFITIKCDRLRYFVIVKVRCKMPILYPNRERFIFTKEDLDEVYKDSHEGKTPKLRTICLVNEAIVDICNGVSIIDFPVEFKKELKLFPPICKSEVYSKYEVYTKLHKYVFPDYFEINSLECDHGLHFFLTIDDVVNFIADSIGYTFISPAINLDKESN